MDITNKTKLKDLLSEYPWLKEELIKFNSKFSLLNSPLAKIMVARADVAMMSEKSGIAQEEIIGKIKEIIENHK